MKYSRKFLDYLKVEVDLFEVIKDEIGKVKFKKSGSDYLILCPFHREETPSFRIF